MRPYIGAIRRRGQIRSVASVLIGTIFYGSLLALATFAAWLFVQLTDRDIPTRTTVEITTPEVRPGADLVMNVWPHLLRRCEGQVAFRIFDREGNSINRSETAWSFPVARVCAKPDQKACPGDPKFVRKLRISRDAVPSLLRPDGSLAEDARMRIERKFYCNAVQKYLQWPIVEVMPDMPFAIAPEERP